MRRLHMWLAVMVAALVIGLVTWTIFAPGWAVATLRQQAAAELGRKLEVRGGARLSLFPLVLHFDKVTLSGATEGEDTLFSVPTLSTPVTLGQLLGRRLDVHDIRLVSPDIALLIDDLGAASFAFASPKSPRDMRITITDGKLRYFDERNNQSLHTSGAEISVTITADGATAVSGTMEINGRLATVEAALKSLSRIHEDGSPFDLNFDSPDLKAEFQGRLSTAKILNLSGTAALSGPSLHRTLRWIGYDLGRDDGPAFAMTGALDSAGRAAAMRQAEITAGGNSATGSVSFDLRQAIPKLEAVLQAHTFDLSAVVPAGGASSRDWGRNPLGLGALRALDATVSLASARLAYGGIETGPAQLAVTLENGKLTSRINAENVAGGAGEAHFTADSAATPAVVDLAFASKAADAAVLLAGLGLPPLKGRGDVAFAVSGQGQTQQEIVGSLKGEATVTLQDGALPGIHVAGVLAAASQRISEGWTDGGMGGTAFATLDASLAIADGIATLTGFSMQSPDISLSVTGEADLLRRSLDLKAAPKLLADGGTVALPVAIVIMGPWNAPRIYPDVPDILSNPAKAFGALKAMGLPAADN